MTLYSAFRNYLNFQVSDLVFRFSFQRNMYIFTRVFTGPNTIESSSKLLKESPVKICCGPVALLKRDSGAVVSCNFLENFQNTRFKEYPSTSAPKGISQQLFFHLNSFDPANIYLLKVNNRRTRKKVENVLKVTIKTSFFTFDPCSKKTIN